MRRTRKWLRRAAVALVAILVVLVGAYAARGPLFEDALIARVEAAAADQLGGGTLSVGSVAGNWVTGATLRGVSWVGASDCPVRELQGAEVELRFDLWDLLRGNPAGLKRVQVQAERLVVDCTRGSSASDDGAAFDLEALAGTLLDGVLLQVEQVELHGTSGSAWRGELQAEVPARGLRAQPLRAEVHLGAARAQLELGEGPFVHFDANVPTAELFAGLFADLPGDLRANLQTQGVLRLAPAWSLSATGSVPTGSIWGRAIDSLTFACALDSDRLQLSELLVSTAGATARLEQATLPLADPLAAQGKLELELLRLAPWLDSLPGGPRMWGLRPAAVTQLGEATGFVRVRLADGVATVVRDETTPGRPLLSLPGCDLRVASGTLPLAQPESLQASVVARLSRPFARLLEGWGALEDLPAMPIGGTVRADLLQRDGVWCLDADADLAMRDADGATGMVRGPIKLRFGEEVVLQPDLAVRGDLLRAVQAMQVTGEVRVGDNVQLRAVTVALGDGGVLEANGTLQASAARRDGASWRDVVAESTADLRLDAVTLQPFAVLLGMPDPGPVTARGTLRLAGEQTRAQLQLDIANLQVPESLAWSAAAGSGQLGAASMVFDLQLAAGKLMVRSCDLACESLQMQVAGEVEGAALFQLLETPSELLRLATRGSARIAAADLERLPLPAPWRDASGGLLAELTLAGSPQSPDVALRFGDSDASVRVGSCTLANPTGTMRWREQALVFEDLGLRIADSTVGLSGSLQRDANGIAGELHGEVAGAPGVLEPLSFRMQVASDAARVSISEFALGNESVSVRGIDVALAAGTDELLSAPAKALQRELGGTLQLEASDLRPVAHLWPRLGIRGAASMRVTLGGSLQQLAPVVDLRLANASLRIPDGPRLNEVTGSLRASAGEITCEQLTASVAGGELQAGGSYRVDGSLFALDGTGWRDGALDLRITGKDCLVRRRGGVKVRADLDVNATGPLADVLLKGTLQTHSSKLVQRYPYFTLGRVGGAAARQGLLFEGPDLGEHVRVRLDLAVTSREPMKIQSNVVTGDVVLALAIRGTLRAPRLEGAVSMPDGRVLFPGVSFRVANALLQFDRDDPFFPTLSLTGTGRRHGFDVRMVVRGRYDQPEIQLSSTPPLPPEQLAVLVATGSRPEALRTTRAVGAVLGSYLVQELADALFGSESTEAKEGFVSRFEVESGTEISANGTESIVVRFRVVDNVFLEGERDVYEDVNLGIVYRIRFR